MRGLARDAHSVSRAAARGTSLGTMGFLLLLLGCSGMGDSPDRSGARGGDTAPDSRGTNDTASGTETAPVAIEPDLVVCADGDYPTIQAAIDAAAPGDRIEVCPGVYGGITVGWGQEVVVIAVAGAEVTTIDGASGSAVQVPGGTLALHGFRIEGGSAANTGGTIAVEEGDLTLQDCVIADTAGSFTVLFDENYLQASGNLWVDNEADFLSPAPRPVAPASAARGRPTTRWRSASGCCSPTRATPTSTRWRCCVGRGIGASAGAAAR